MLDEGNEMEVSLPGQDVILEGNNAFKSSSPAVDVSQEGQTLGSLAAITNVAISQVVGINIARSSINSESSFTSRDTREETSQPRPSRFSLREDVPCNQNHVLFKDYILQLAVVQGMHNVRRMAEINFYFVKFVDELLLFIKNYFIFTLEKNFSCYFALIISLVFKLSV